MARSLVPLIRRYSQWGFFFNTVGKMHWTSNGMRLMKNSMCQVYLLMVDLADLNKLINKAN